MFTSSPELGYNGTIHSLPTMCISISPIIGSIIGQFEPEAQTRSIENSSEIVAIEESSIPEETVSTSLPREINYEILKNGSQKKTDILLDGLGFSYTIKSKFPKTVIWMCTHRSGTNPCRGTVNQTNSGFELKRQHNHSGNIEINDKIKIRHEIKLKALENKYVSAKNIVEDVFISNRRRNRKIILPHEGNTIRIANRIREQNRPPNPRERGFVLNEKFVNEHFFRGEIRCGINGNSRRHLLFMSDTQIETLARAKRWYVDGTFKIIDSNLFCQLFTIHAFLKKGEEIKQVPLAFVFMESRKTLDYQKVFEKIIEILPFLRVKEIVSDFEKALWKSIKNLNDDPDLKLFKNVRQFGCAFHFTNAIYRKIQKIGLSTLYNKDREVKELCRQIMCINMIHYKDISFILYFLREKCSRSTHHELLLCLLNYVEKNWINNVLWIPKFWSVYKQPIRTNNDAEGWHLRINRRGRDGTPPFYNLLELLYKEAELIPLQAELLNQKKLKRSHRKKYNCIQHSIFKHWKEYEQKKNTIEEISPWKLLKLVSLVYSFPNM